MLNIPPEVCARRPRRNRKSKAIRALVQEVRIHPSDLIYPLFVIDGHCIKQPISSMPEIHRMSVDMILKEVERAAEWGIVAIALFPVIPSELKDELGSESARPDGLMQKTIRMLKTEFPQMCVIGDVALDPYTSHGHDGLVNGNGEILNDTTIDKLIEMALVQAEAGVDMVAPSDMMDGRIKAIRSALDAHNFTQVSIHAYTAKYASAFYSPFRNALGSDLQFGDKKTYQMNPANAREALLEASLDEEEGADVLMVKPALLYLDIIAKIKAATHLPVSAFQVSGEYAMIMAAAKNGWLDGKQALWESIVSIKRAGADMIFTYGALKIAEDITTGAHD